MGRGGYNGGNTILFRGQFAPEGQAVVRGKPSKPFSDDYEKPAKEERKAPPPQVIRKEKTLKPVRPAKPKVIPLDKFGLPVGLAAEGVPGPNERSHYLDADANRQFFNRVKALILEAARRGAVVLSDFLIALTDSKIRTLRGSAWKREYVSGLIYDIRVEKYLPKPQPAVQQVQPAVSSTPNVPRVHRMERPKQAPMEKQAPVAKAASKDTSTDAAAELLRLERRIAELEQAWDDAFTLGQRKKIRDQLDATKRKRKKLHECFR